VVAQASIRITLAAAIAAGRCASPGCGSGDGDEPDPKVMAFLRERVIRFVPPGGKLAFRYEGEEERADFFLPSWANVRRVYAYDTARSARAARLAVVDIAEADGWRVTGGSGPSNEAVFAAKELSTGDATLTIDDYYSEGEFKLSVGIEDGLCSPTLCRE
jgi:hypothetical protein